MTCTCALIRPLYKNTYSNYPISTSAYMMTSSNGNIFRATGHLCGEFTGSPTQRPVTRSFDVNFDLRPNKRLSKQSWGWWFETPSRPFWRHRNVSVRLPCVTAAFQMLRPCKQKPITEIFICLLSRSVAEQADTSKYIDALYLSLYLVCFVILFILQCSVAARMSNVSHLYLMLITIIMASAEKITPIPGIYAPAPI